MQQMQSSANDFLDDLVLPDSVRRSLESLSKDILFESNSSKGANGYLFFGRNQILNRKIAVKYYYWGNDHEYHAEPMYLSSCRGENVLPIHHAERICDEWAYYITDYCKNGDLDDYVTKAPLSIKNQIDLVIGILNGLSVLHGKRLLHRDLKPQNILISDEYKPVIGDFGSVKKIPDSKDSIPGSGHSILYRPPESCRDSVYSVAGDIYQVGLVFYQLIRGKLSYEGEEYLSSREMEIYKGLPDDVERAIYIDTKLKDLICKGKLLDYSSIPCWISKDIIRIIQKATHRDKRRRYLTSSAMMNELCKIRNRVADWLFDGKNLYIRGKKNYRIIKNGELYTAQKIKHSEWNNDNAIEETKNIKEIIGVVEKLVRK